MTLHDRSAAAPYFPSTVDQLNEIDAPIATVSEAQLRLCR
jgi:hypothetical protein